MSLTTLEEVNQAIMKLLAIHQAVRANLESLEDTILKIAEQIPVSQIEGVPIAAWHAQRRREKLQELMISVEDRDPAFAALIQQQLDGFLK